MLLQQSTVIEQKEDKENKFENIKITPLLLYKRKQVPRLSPQNLTNQYSKLYGPFQYFSVCFNYSYCLIDF